MFLEFVTLLKSRVEMAQMGDSPIWAISTLDFNKI